MSELKVGHCLPLYLKNRLLLSTLEEDDGVSLVDSGDQKVLAQFRERASEQAVGLLEDLYSELIASTMRPLPYRTDRRSQRRTVRENWYVEGRIFRPREKIARAYWRLVLASLRDKGPAVALIVGPQDPAAPMTFDELSKQVAGALELESANPRTCFTHLAGYDAGTVASYAELAVGAAHGELATTMKKRLDVFLSRFRDPFEAALSA